MKIIAIFSFAILAVSPLLADEAGDAMLAKSPIVGSTLTVYNKLAVQIEIDRAKALHALNEKFLAELVRTKSVALKAEKLEEAIAIDAKIKEVTEANVVLKELLNGSPTATVVSGTFEFKRVAKKVMDWAAKSNLSDEQKAVLKDFCSGKLAARNDMPGKGYTYFNKNGDLCEYTKGGKVVVNASSDLKFEDGTIRFSNDCDIYFDKIMTKALPMRWTFLQYKRVLIPYSDLADVMEGKGSSKKEVVKTNGSKDSASKDSDDTVFGRRQR